MELDYLSLNPSLTPELIEKYIEKLDWFHLSGNPSLTPELIEKYAEKWNWLYLFRSSAIFDYSKNIKG